VPYNGRVLYVGHLAPGQTSLMRADAMERLEIEIVRFDARAFLQQRGFLERRVSDTFERSPAIYRLNKALVQTAERERPNLVWFDKQEYIFSSTVQRLKELGTFLVFYTPDPYFQHNWHQTNTMNRNFSEIDLFVTTKSYELDEYRKYGDVYYMPHGYSETVHRPMTVARNETVDFGFIGSWEPRREAFIERVAKAGLRAKVWGFGWDHLKTGRAGLRTRMRLRRMANGEPYTLKKSQLFSDILAPGEIYADAYSRAISMSNISPGLLRTTLYPDQHTTRTFEIPACGSMLLAERTPEHEDLFMEDREAVFFATDDELVDKALWYTKNSDARIKIARAGRARCEHSGYSYKERLRRVLHYISGVMGDRSQ